MSDLCHLGKTRLGPEQNKRTLNTLTTCSSYNTSYFNSVLLVDSGKLKGTLSGKITSKV